jgi:hypothetical protein
MGRKLGGGSGMTEAIFQKSRWDFSGTRGMLAAGIKIDLAQKWVYSTY